MYISIGSVDIPSKIHIMSKIVYASENNKSIFVFSETHHLGLNDVSIQIQTLHSPHNCQTVCLSIGLSIMISNCCQYE